MTLISNESAWDDYTWWQLQGDGEIRAAACRYHYES